MKHALVTGISGQDGAYLARFLLEKGYRVTGTVRRLDAGLGRLGISGEVELLNLELGEANAITRLLRSNRYDEIYNLAARSFVGSSWDEPLHVAEVNGMAVLRLLDGLRSFSPETRFYQASTSEMFGLVRQTPQNEETAFHPRSPYAVAKLFAHSVTVNYRESFGIHASSGILFNHESPLRGAQFVTRKITLGLARFARGERKPIALGNLDASRDWGFAGDYVEGMWSMLQQPQADDYVLATGISTTVRDFAGFAAQALDIELAWEGSGKQEKAIDRKSGHTVIEVNPHFYRPAEVSALQGDARKAEAKLGWKPRMSVRELAALMARADYDALPA